MSPTFDPTKSKTKRYESARAAEQAYSASLARSTYLVPLILLIAGLLIGAGWPSVSAWREAGADAAAVVAMRHLISLAVMIPTGLVALLVTCRIFSAEAGPIGLVLLRLAAVYAVISIIASPLQSAPACYTYLVTIAMVAGLIAVLFDMELAVGAFAALVIWIVHTAIYLGMALAFGD